MRAIAEREFMAQQYLPKSCNSIQHVSERRPSRLADDKTADSGANHGRRWRALVLFVALWSVGLSGLGCAPGRLDDLADCGRISVGVGLGFEGHAKLGCLTHPSLGIVGSANLMIGHENRHVTGFWGDVRLVTPVWTLIAASGRHASPDLLLNFTSSHCITVVTLESLMEEEPQDRAAWTQERFWLPLLLYLAEESPEEMEYGDPLAFNQITDLEIGGTWIVVSGRIGINPLEIADFLLGFVGLDIAGDDQPGVGEKR